MVDNHRWERRFHGQDTRSANGSRDVSVCRRVGHINRTVVGHEERRKILSLVAVVGCFVGERLLGDLGKHVGAATVLDLSDGQQGTCEGRFRDEKRSWKRETASEAARAGLEAPMASEGGLERLPAAPWDLLEGWRVARGAFGWDWGLLGLRKLASASTARRRPTNFSRVAANLSTRSSVGKSTLTCDRW